MFGLQSLDVILGLGLVYLILSLVCSAVQEGIAAMFNLRATILRRGIENILAPASGTAVRDGGTTVSIDAFYAHPLIAGLRERGIVLRRQPGYVPARTFALTLLDLVLPVEQRGDGPLQELAQRVRTLPEHLRRPLLVLITQADGDLRKFQDGVEWWFNNSMERLSAVYKRTAQLIILPVAITVTLAANADTLQIVRALSANVPLREAIADRATTVADAGGASAASPASARSVAARLDSLNRQLDSLRLIGLPLGWPALSEAGTGAKLALRAKDAGRRLPGLLITVLALSLGAPFWFDVLNKIVNVRSAGRAPEERPKRPEVLPPAQGAGTAAG